MPALLPSVTWSPAASTAPLLASVDVAAAPLLSQPPAERSCQARGSQLSPSGCRHGSLPWQCWLLTGLLLSVALSLPVGVTLFYPSPWLTQRSELQPVWAGRVRTWVGVYIPPSPLGNPGHTAVTRAPVSRCRAAVRTPVRYAGSRWGPAQRWVGCPAHPAALATLYLNSVSRLGYTVRSGPESADAALWWGKCSSATPPVPTCPAWPTQHLHTQTLLILTHPPVSAS